MTNALDLIDDWGPEKIVVVSHRRTGMKGVLVIDNTARGVGKGGTRMAPTVTVTEVARLARVMTWKWASVDLFYGGAKAGIVADPASPDKEAILRAFARALSNEVPREYVMGLDMGLTEDDAAVIQDELGDRGAAVGTPAHLGGIAYDQLGVTGYGVAETSDAAARQIGLALSGSRVSIQGFGAVGTAAARRFRDLGATVVAVSTAHGVLHDPQGLDVDVLTKARTELGDGFITQVGSGTPLQPGEELTVDCDVLVPAALQDVIDERTADQVKARLVVEGANLPTTTAAQATLAARGVTVVPDFIANAGGVIAAAFAMDARYSGFRPEPDTVFATISDKLRANAVTVL
jgi:glutamate dehydrogenase (NAD(P)+)